MLFRSQLGGGRLPLEEGELQRRGGQPRLSSQPLDAQAFVSWCVCALQEAGPAQVPEGWPRVLVTEVAAYAPGDGGPGERPLGLPFLRSSHLQTLWLHAEGELFEAFLHRRFVGTKRYSLEVAAGLVPLVATLLERGAEHGVKDEQGEHEMCADPTSRRA